MGALDSGNADGRTDRRRRQREVVLHRTVNAPSFTARDPFDSGMKGYQGGRGSADRPFFRSFPTEVSSSEEQKVRAEGSNEGKTSPPTRDDV